MNNERLNRLDTKAKDFNTATSASAKAARISRAMKKLHKRVGLCMGLNATCYHYADHGGECENSQE